MKRVTIIILVFISVSVFGQKTSQTSNDFVVTGQIKMELKFTCNDIEKYPSNTIRDVTITNHLGESRGTAKALKGILIKDLLNGMQLKEESARQFSEFYLTFVAADNYKVVYSWNEIFNSPTGDNVYIITSKEGKMCKDMDERILIITPTDYKTGRRYIKGLSKIIVNRVD